MGFKNFLNQTADLCTRIENNNITLNSIPFIGLILFIRTLFKLMSLFHYFFQLLEFHSLEYQSSSNFGYLKLLLIYFTEEFELKYFRNPLKYNFL